MDINTSSSQKIENMLNLSLSLEETQRERAAELEVGFDERTNTWELILKYNGDLLQYEREGIRIEPLIAGYAIVTIQENLIRNFVANPEVEYVEMPKRLFYSVTEGKAASCFQSTATVRGLSGKGVLVAIVDSGIDYESPAFRKADGTTRIRFLWDQSLQPREEGQPPESFFQGIEYSEEQINRALAENMPLPTLDITGHGTAVAAIAAGKDEEQSLVGGAPESDLLIVKLGNADKLSFPRTTELMRAVTYAVRKAMELNMPLALNLSFGNTYGAHDGTSILERFLDNASEIGRTVICVGSGNEGAAAGHTAGALQEERTTQVELAVGNYQSSFGIQLWKNYVDLMELYLVSPGGDRRQISLTVSGKQQFALEQTEILLYIGEPSPYSVDQEIYFELLPLEEAYVRTGVWRFEMRGIRIVSGNFLYYLPSEQVLSSDTRFYAPVPQSTLTIPSTASKVITVGAYNSTYDGYADFSGRGYPDEGILNGSRESSTFYEAGQTVKPDLVAPGVGIRTLRVGGGVEYVSGTSFATPFVTAAAALLMEWGILQGNDSYLYGEKVKAYLRRGARPLRGERQLPNARVGYGKLCVADSLS